MVISLLYLLVFNFTFDKALWGLLHCFVDVYVFMIKKFDSLSLSLSRPLPSSLPATELPSVSMATMRRWMSWIRPPTSCTKTAFSFTLMTAVFSVISTSWTLSGSAPTSPKSSQCSRGTPSKRVVNSECKICMILCKNRGSTWNCELHVDIRGIYIDKGSSLLQTY